MVKGNSILFAIALVPTYSDGWIKIRFLVADSSQPYVEFGQSW